VDECGVRAARECGGAGKDGLMIRSSRSRYRVEGDRYQGRGRIALELARAVDLLKDLNASVFQ